MKNKYFEIKRRKQREALSKYRDGSLVDGVSIFHLYEEERKNELTYWDDFSILLANRRLMVWFVHPRMAYSDACKELAYKKVEHLYPSRRNDLLETTKVYKKVGNSRKKASGYSTLGFSDIFKNWCEEYDKAEKRISLESDIIIKPNFTLESTSWAQGINLVIPEEIRSASRVVDVAKLAKKLYKNETNLQELYGDYQYSREDWVREYSGLAQ